MPSHDLDPRTDPLDDAGDVVKYAAVNINFDSLGEAYGFPTDYRDPSFHAIADRFFAIADKYGFKYSIYIIAKDLERPENRAAVRRWSEMGHEIGNHTYHHRVNLGALSSAELDEEIGRAHGLIGETTGVAPTGFIAPVWATSQRVLEKLIELGYTYDTSAHPSWLMLPSLLKMTVNHLGNERMWSFLSRRDYGYFLAGSRHPFLTNGDLYGRGYDPSKRALTVLPLPSTPTRMACWHTLAFMFDWPVFERILKSCLASLDTFYYLVHPADLAQPADLDPSMKLHLERLDVPLATKIAHLERSIEHMLSDGRRIVTMHKLARYARQTIEARRAA